MASTSETWNHTFKPNLLKILRVQQIFVFTGVLLYAFLAALQIHISFSFLMVCFGNWESEFCPTGCQRAALWQAPFPLELGHLPCDPDSLDVIRLDDSRLGICIGDVSGKGITAALLMANLQAAFRAYATRDAKPSEVCGKLNEFVCGKVAPGKFITFFHAILDARNRTLTYENAGHCAGLLMRATGETEQLRGQGGVLGVQPEWTYADSTLALASGDRLLFFTDGVTEAENAKEEEFGYQGVAKAAGTGASSAPELKSKIMKAVEEFCRGEIRDDVTLVAACIR